jgi:nucleoside-diphosphate-sugar epimerase
MSVVLVTGAGGFIGSAIVRRLVSGSAQFADGARIEHVVALLRPNGSTARLDELPRNGSWSVERADVDDRDTLGAVLERLRPRAIVHAALDAEAYLVEDEDRFAGRPLTTMLAGLAGVQGSRFLQVGSAWVLGAGDHLDESAPLEPLTPYARNKASTDILLPALADRFDVPWLNLRLFNTFGRYEKAQRLLPMLVARLSRGESAELTRGDQVRDFTDVETMAEAFVCALAAPERACGRVYHVGSGRGTTVRDFALTVAAAVGTPDLIRFGVAAAEDEGLACLVADPARTESALGWRPLLDLRGRVRATVDWWLEQLGTRNPVRVQA